MIVGGIIPEQDVARCSEAGVAAVYTPKDFDITRIMRDIVALLARRRAAEAPAARASERHRARRQRRVPGVSADGAALAARLREHDLGAAPAALNLLESTAPGIASRPSAAARALPRGAGR